MKRLILACLCLIGMGCENSSILPATDQDPDPDIARNPDDGALLVSASVELPADSMVANEEVRLTPDLVFSGPVDTSKVKYSWSLTENGLPVPLQAATDPFLDWIPSKPGRYSAHLSVEYEGRRVDIFVMVVVVAGKDEGVELETLRKGMLGSWKGQVTTPWKSPYLIEMDFRADGGYSARALDGRNTPALYYGTDDDSDRKIFGLDDVLANGDGAGEIQIYFGPGSTTTDELRHVRLGPDGKSLTFDIWHLGQYGPVHVELTRSP